MSAFRIVPRRPFGACLLALAAACSDSPTGPPASEAVASLSARELSASVPDISGTWSYKEVASLVIWNFDDQPTKTFHCISNGTYTFVQSGATFTGSFDQTGTCVAKDGTTLDNSFTDTAVTGGTIDGRQLLFHPDPPPCDYEGKLLGKALNRIEGDGVCGVPGIATYTVRWLATR